MFSRMTLRMLLWLIAISTFILLAEVHASATKAGPKVGDVPPPLKLTKTLQGAAAADLTWDKLRGKVVVLEFWGTKCGPCIQAIPHLNELADHFKGRPVVFISITDENEEVVQEFLKKHPMQSCIGFDNYEEMKTAYAVYGIPHAVVVDAGGRVAAIDHPALIRASHLEEVLAGKTCSLPVSEPEVEFSSIQESDASAPPIMQVLIQKSTREHTAGGATCCWTVNENGCSFKGEVATVESALKNVFGTTWVRMIVETRLPEDFYEFHFSAPAGQAAVLQEQARLALLASFGLEVKRVNKEVTAYRLTVRQRGLPGLQPGGKAGGGQIGSGSLKMPVADVTMLAQELEKLLGVPVVDETGLAGHFSVHAQWKMSELELALERVDRRVWKAMDSFHKKPTEADLRSVLPPEFFEGESLKNIRLVLAELQKPGDQQFLPDSTALIQCVNEQLGLELTPVKKQVNMLLVQKQPDLRKD